ncbi:hypothetical protein LAB1_06880 [Roseibium sp. LAB1]
MKSAGVLAKPLEKAIGSEGGGIALELVRAKQTGARHAVDPQRQTACRTMRPASGTSFSR